jgi:hypothetical protein
MSFVFMHPSKYSKNRIDKKMKAKDDKSLFADIDKIEFDVINELTDTLNEMYQKEKSKGQTFSDWLKSKDIEELKRIELSNGGTAESYADLIDAYEKNIDVMPGESLTEYIKRVRAAEAKEGN